MTEPALILADEPTGNLDSSSTADVLDLLEELNRDGRTIVLITHEHDIAQRALRTVADPRRAHLAARRRTRDGPDLAGVAT